MKKLFIAGISIVFATYIFSTSWIYFNQNKFIYNITSSNAPDSLLIPYRSVEFKNGNQTLSAHIIPAVGDKKEWVIFCHGAETTINSIEHINRFKVWHNLNLNILAFDYIGYGKSDGQASELGLYESAKAAYHYLKNIEFVPEEKIIIYGEGLGVAVALDLARQINVAGVILENGFTSLPELCQETYPLLPMRQLITSEFNCLNKVDRILTPKLILYANENQKIPPIHSQIIYSSSLKPKKIIAIQGDHHEAPKEDALSYQRALSNYLQDIRWK